MPFIDIIEDGVVSKLEWSPNPSTKFNRKKEAKVAPVLTFGQEIEEAVREYCLMRNMPVSPEDLQVCREIDGIEEAEYKKVAEAVTVPKPTYGTPEFWKDWWAKKKAKEAEGSTPANSQAKKQKSSVPKSAKLTGQASQS
jgi:hypothetical protein